MIAQGVKYRTNYYTQCPCKLLSSQVYYRNKIKIFLLMLTLMYKRQIETIRVNKYVISDVCWELR